MSTAGDKIKEKLAKQGKAVNKKLPKKESGLKKSDIDTLVLQMLKDFGYVTEG